MTNTFVQHCITLYTALDDRAKTQKLQSGDKARVFAGNYTDVFAATKLSRTYYTSTRKALEKHNAILILQRGGKGTDTVIVLRGLPKTWDIEGWNDGHLTIRREPATVEGVEELRAEILKTTGGINVIAALAQFEERVVALESQVAEILETLRKRNK